MSSSIRFSNLQSSEEKRYNLIPHSVHVFCFALICDNVPNRSAADDDSYPIFIQLLILHALFLTSNPGNNYFPVHPKYHILSVNISSYYDHIHLQNYFQNVDFQWRGICMIFAICHILYWYFFLFCMAM